MEGVDLLGVAVWCGDQQALIHQAVGWATAETPRTLTYVNAHCLNLAAQDAAYRALLNRADLVYSDGIGVVWAAHLLAKVRLHKLTGRVWIEAFCQQAAAAGLSLYLLGGRPGISRRAAENLQGRHPGLQVAGCSDGFFESRNAAVLAEIARLRPQVVLVGLGVPAQETWIAAHRSQIAAPVCWAVGALFDYLAGAESPAPAWVDALALEWFWRLLADPRGKWRRYLLGNPAFVVRVLRYKWKQGKG